MSTDIQSNYVIKSLVSLLHDEPNPAIVPGQKSEILEAYFNDLYKLFLGKLAKFEAATNVGEEDRRRLKSVLDELVNVKLLLVD